MLHSMILTTFLYRNEICIKYLHHKIIFRIILRFWCVHLLIMSIVFPPTMKYMDIMLFYLGLGNCELNNLTNKMLIRSLYLNVHDLDVILLLFGTFYSHPAWTYFWKDVEFIRSLNNIIPGRRNLSVVVDDCQYYCYEERN